MLRRSRAAIRCRAPAAASNQNRAEPKALRVQPTYRNLRSRGSRADPSRWRGIQALRLQHEQLRDAGGGEIQERIELVAPERMAFSAALYFDVSAAVVHNDVHVGLSLGVLGVVEIEHGCSCDNADRYGRNLSVQRTCTDRAPPHEPLAGLCKSNVRPGDRGRACPAVRLQHITIQRHGTLAERLQINDCAQRATDEALDLLSSAALFAARRLARTPRMRGTRQHAVFGRYPPLAFAAQKMRYAIFDTRGAQHLGIATLDEYRAFSMLAEAARQLHGTQLIGIAPTRPCAHKIARSLDFNRRASAARQRRCCRCPRQRAPPRVPPTPIANRATSLPGPQSAASSRCRAKRPTGHRCTREIRRRARPVAAA